MRSTSDLTQSSLYMSIRFIDWDSRLHCIRLVNKSPRSFGSMDNVKINISNENIDMLTIFLSDQCITSTGWIKEKHTLGVCTGFEKVDCDMMLYPKILSYDIECYSLSHGMPKSYQIWDEIIMIGTTLKRYSLNNPIRKTFILSKICNIVNDDIVTCDSEYDMITKFMSYINYVDPVIIVGYNIYGFDIPYILSRLELNLRNIPINISRDDTNTKVRSISMETNAFGAYEGTIIVSSGRISMDLLTIYIRNDKLKVRTLNEVSRIFLNQEKLDISPKDIFLSVECSTKSNIQKLIDYCIQDTILVLNLIDKSDMWITWTEESAITCVLIEDLYIRGATHRACTLFYKECLTNSINIVKIESESYIAKGGYVFDPTIGLHNNVTCVDFKSLYPSIMIEHNICISTYKDGIFVKEPKGIIPNILISLIRKRADISNRIKQENDNNIKNILNARQLSLKICANGIYGVLSTPYDHILRFSYAADEITRLGRMYVTSLYTSLTETFGLRCVYGDTDSCYISDDGISKEQLILYTNNAISYINSKLPLNIKIAFERHVDKIFILSKKKYVLIVKGEMIHKGNVSIRKDNCEFLRNMYTTILNIILIKEYSDKVLYQYIMERYYDLLSGSIDIHDLIYTCPVKSDYKISSNQYNIMIKRLKSNGINISVNDRIPYLYVVLSFPSIQGYKMYTYDEVIENNLIIDYRFYFDTKIYPTISKLMISLGYNDMVKNMNSKLHRLLCF